MSAAVAVVLALLELLTGHDLRRDLLGRAVHAWIGLAVPVWMVSSSVVADVVIVLVGVALVLAVVTRTPPPRIDRAQARADLDRVADRLHSRSLSIDDSDEARVRAR